MHRIHLQIKLHNTITHKHVNRSWYMESPQRHLKSKVANATAPSSPAAPPAVIKRLRAPPATTKAARSATVPISGHGQVVSFRSLKLCNRLSYIITCNVFSVDDLGTEDQRAARVPPLQPPTAPEAVVDNLRCHQWRLSRHHGNSRPSVDVHRVKISAKANLPLSQIPPPRRRDTWNATSVVLSSLDFSCPYGRAPTCQNQSWTGPMLIASDRYPTRRWPARASPHGKSTGMHVIHDYNFLYIYKHINNQWGLGSNSQEAATRFGLSWWQPQTPRVMPGKSPWQPPLHQKFETCISLSLIMMTNVTIDNGALSWI